MSTAPPRQFANRREAGRELGAALGKLELRPPVVVLGLARGGLPVASEVADALSARLDVLAVRKIGMPGEAELAVGAIAAGDVTVRHPPPGSPIELSAQDFAALERRERSELERRERLYRAGLPPLELTGSTAVLVDDGLATGATMLAAIRAARRAGARVVIVAVPVASGEAAALVRPECERLVVLQTPGYFYAVGQWYRDFSQVEDAEVCRLLAARRTAQPHGRTG
ncbi:MAG TPA: phosphoribosyltransferase family protein [Steroidobacteraceae bacterium]|nr:phosphoribosyltransferase family protein [Steroidobacteraceae bacterium]